MGVDIAHTHAVEAVTLDKGEHLFVMSLHDAGHLVQGVQNDTSAVQIAER
jgi:hypothetical protein